MERRILLILTLIIGACRTERTDRPAVEEDPRQVAGHEGGHATYALLHPETFRQVSSKIVDGLGSTTYEHLTAETEVQLRQRIAWLISGCSAEILFFDGDCIGNKTDAVKALELAKSFASRHEGLTAEAVLNLASDDVRRTLLKNSDMLTCISNELLQHGRYPDNKLCH